MLVEDNAIVAISMEVLFRQKGWHVQSIATMTGALALLDSKPDWVILDLMLPDGEGVKVIQEVRRRNLPIRVAVTTGASDPQLLTQVRALQPDVMLRKPITASDLYAALQVP